VLDVPLWLPAAGQGAIALIARQGDASTHKRLAVLDDPDTRAATTAERAFLRALEGGCQIPIGALAHVYDAQLVLHGFVGSLDGRDASGGLVGGVRFPPPPGGRSLPPQPLGPGPDSILHHIREHDPLALPGASPP
jgi:hydroxymethylbilane synthase